MMINQCEVTDRMLVRGEIEEMKACMWLVCARVRACRVQVTCVCARVCARDSCMRFVCAKHFVRT